MFFAVMGYLVPEKLSFGIEPNIPFHSIYRYLMFIITTCIVLL